MINPRNRSILALVALLGQCLTISALAAEPSSNSRGGIEASPSLKTPVSPTEKAGADGFISRWLLLEPIPGDGRVVDSAIEAAAKKEYFPGQYFVIPRPGETVSIGGAEYRWHAVDTIRHNVNLYHFAYFLGKPTSNAAFWGVTVVESPEEISGVRLAIGSNAGSVWWVNGQKVIAIYGDRLTYIDDGVSKKLTLNKGPNIVRFLVVNNGGMVDCCARFLDRDDKPLTNLTFSLTDPAKK